MRRKSCSDFDQPVSSSGLVLVVALFQSMTLRVSGSLSSSTPISMSCGVNGISRPDGPSRSLRRARRVLVMVPLSGVAEQGEHHIGVAFLGGAATSAGVDGLAEVVDAKHERARPGRQVRKHLHDLLPDGGVIVVARLGVSGGGDDRVDEDQREIDAEVCEMPLGLLRHARELVERVGGHKRWAACAPRERQRAGDAALFGDGVEPRFQAACAFWREVGDTCSALHGEAVGERRPGHDADGHIERHGGFERAPLAGYETGTSSRQELLYQVRRRRRRLAS